MAHTPHIYIAALGKHKRCMHASYHFIITLLAASAMIRNHTGEREGQLYRLSHQMHALFRVFPIIITLFTQCIILFVRYFDFVFSMPRHVYIYTRSRMSLRDFPIYV